MRAKANQNKFMKIVSIPVRVLCKARDFYVRSMTNCTTGMVYRQSEYNYPSGLPRSFSAASTRSNESEDYRDLLRAASVRSLGHINELDMYMKQMMRQQQPLVGDHGISSNKGLMPKSTSVGMGFMGRIDEEKAYEEISEDGSVKKPELYPRSKSYAVGKTNVADAL
ncbi:hypothetical protein Tsubulata_045049 [Turnera subulata]|uniref:Uncharacterized protein n=1 Tax=Turnera subulata TaxID=218843 RepID=A0A9Q0GDF1_9ROSI|nr:hypothetical protein Tsubulata_045049 [Turnera subulata]